MRKSNSVYPKAIQENKESTGKDIDNTESHRHYTDGKEENVIYEETEQRTQDDDDDDDDDDGTDVVDSGTGDGLTPLMKAALAGNLEQVKGLIAQGAGQLHAQGEGNETALTLTREGNVIKQIVASVKELRAKTKHLKEEDIATELEEETATVLDSIDYTRMIENLCPNEAFKREEIIVLEKKFRTILPVYKAIREKLLKAGAYDVRTIKNQETRYVLMRKVMWPSVLMV